MINQLSVILHAVLMSDNLVSAKLLAKTAIETLENSDGAKIEKDLIPVLHNEREIAGAQVQFLTIDCPEGWSDVKKICKKVLSYRGTKFTFSAWNSDRNVCYFREATSFATVAKK